jgi:nucleotide-binding universal stress UspA family protein
MSWLPKKSIVVPVDFSGESSHALSVALELVEDPSALHLVHVLYPLDSVSPGVVWGGVTEETREKAVRECFDKSLTELGVSGANVDVLFGDPGIEIAEYAKKIGAELIVISSHGHHGVRRVLLGSVAERVVRHATCPLLVLRRSDVN